MPTLRPANHPASELEVNLLWFIKIAFNDRTRQNNCFEENDVEKEKIFGENSFKFERIWEREREDHGVSNRHASHVKF